MNTSLLRICVLIPALSPLVSFAATPLVSETFEEPNGRTYTFPPKDDWRDHLRGRLSGWSGDGAVAITYGEALGKDGTGGIMVAVARAGTNFAFAKLQHAVPGLIKGSVTAEQVKDLVLVFDIRGDQPLKILTTLQTTHKDAWPSRIDLSTITLTPKWTTVRLPLSKAKPEEITRFVENINQSETADIDIAFYLAEFSAWQETDAFQLDNVGFENASN
ncbi:MAG: hypothetical protein H2172_08325 [Opitutus sp.]|nr:hypothetical protein [Opitutus sp.]MCS6246588.1 hypothetical protein [Opitutus sp.]MCS6272728.1 hypothetical protein [Opitutus sp.]MCS6276359.1 hypothetical protein [Opitutus sp.]MCS6301993.1 hypothetical protein [Opitutus sp.]